MAQDIKDRVAALQFLSKEKGYAQYPGTHELRRVLPYGEAMEVIGELTEREAKLVEALKNMTYYANIIVNPKGKGIIKPTLAMDQLNSAKDLVEELGY